MAHDAIRDALAVVLRDMGVQSPEIQLERPRDPTHGDVATNVALSLARQLKRPPREIAEEIAKRLDPVAAGVEAIDVAGPGFLNFRLNPGAVASVVDQILGANESYGSGDVGHGRRVMVEFVSANPTGPLHLGHGRQAALGDAIAALLTWTGWAVHREYYYNDSGRQMELLAESVRARYRQALGKDVEMPAEGYQGEYVKDVADSLQGSVNDRYLDDDTSEALDSVRTHAVAMLRAEQDRDLNDFRVYFDEYFLESSLYDQGLVDDTIRALGDTGLVYELDGATWLRTTEFGDQKDRVMVRSNGHPTYFLPDIAYHMSKWGRGFERVINVQGADHHGTVDRVRAGLQALGRPPGYPEYVLHQMVRVEKDGEEVKFSKRAGSGMTLRELYEQVGVDVTRYFFQMRKPDAHLLFDLDVALDHSDKNPVYKVQYAHARMCSIFGKAEIDLEAIAAGQADLTLLTHDLERELVKQLGEFPATIERAAEHTSPHMLCDYLEQTAGAANSWYHAGNPSRNPELAVLVSDPAVRTARLALARAVQIVLRNGLTLLGIEAPRRMIREVPDDHEPEQ
ncbi:MAG: arginine--tRNA ligase [Gemmatimonadetes bacterium]|nr:arginine--tRNA ligase [Gemmatimonadota bacterium]MDA1104713.1 arginine--tRNA ligase [Gemmatimonadota bacterium]